MSKENFKENFDAVVVGAGFAGRGLGENISESFDDELQVLQSWIDDPVTRSVMRSPEADSVELIDAKTGKAVVSLGRVTGGDGVFAAEVPRRKKRFDYKLRMTRGGNVWTEYDPYAFGNVLGEFDEYLLGEGTHGYLWKALGAHVMTHEGVEGTHFAVWAPNARRVSVVGDFNGWDGRRFVMRRRGATGVHEIFVPDVADGTAYKYEVLGIDDQLMPLKADPVGFGAELPPRTASVVRDLSRYDWQDGDWMARRGGAHRIDRPISVYEVHLESWRRVPEEDGRSLSYREMADALVSYVKEMGFTHIETTPISEYPFGGSWGYQPVGLYAPTSRFGTPDDFRYFVDACHQAGIGLIIDWVPGHFPTDEHGLGRFDGSALYEHADPKEGYHPDWNTLVYNYGRTEVANYLIANAKFWVQEYHIDGLRVDAVASMLYRDYSRKEGEWVPNIHGGRENLEAISFMQRMNEAVYADQPDIMTIAEESTAFPGVSAPTDTGGLGFGFKWNMGWMNDTLRYMGEDPIHRKYHHDKMTFGLHYAFSENFVLPLSHDEVVHGKGSILDRMPGDDWQRFANLRAYYGFMWGHPGKKLLFMSCEFGQWDEWNNEKSLDWHLLEYPTPQRRAVAGPRSQPPLSRHPCALRARQQARGLPLDRRRQRRRVGVFLAPPRQGRQRPGAGGLQFHAGDTTGLSHRRAAGGNLGGGSEHRCGRLCRQQPGQRHPAGHDGRVGAWLRAVDRADRAAAGDNVPAL